MALGIRFSIISLKQVCLRFELCVLTPFNVKHSELNWITQPSDAIKSYSLTPYRYVLSRFLPSFQATSRVPQVLLQLCSNLASFMCQNSPAVIS